LLIHCVCRVIDRVLVVVGILHSSTGWFCENCSRWDWSSLNVTAILSC